MPPLFDSDDDISALLCQTRTRSTPIESQIAVACQSSEEEKEEAVKELDFRTLLKRYEPATDLMTLYPPSLWQDDESHTPASEEFDVIRAIIESGSQQAAVDEFEEIDVSNFCVYNSVEHARYPGQYVPLNIVASERDKGAHRIDGLICYQTENGVQRTARLTNATIRDVNIGGMDKNVVTAAHCIWIQTKSCPPNCWYKLTQPSKEYSEIWNQFIWLADFVKHCIDFLLSESSISVHSFQSRFHSFICQVHGDHPELSKWLSLRGVGTDYRRHLLQHYEFLYDQVYSLIGDETCAQLMNHPLWTQLGRGGVIMDRAINSDAERTVVTPRVFDSITQVFPKWGPKSTFTPDAHDLLEQLEMTPQVLERCKRNRIQAGLPDKYRGLKTDDVVLEGNKRISRPAWWRQDAVTQTSRIDIERRNLLNMVVLLRTESQGNCRKSAPQDSYQFALVLQETKKRQKLKVAGLLLPADTVLNFGSDETYYPIGNELFLSCACNCRTVSVTDVISVHSVSLFTECAGDNIDLLLRSRYVEDEEIFVDVMKDELTSGCQNPRCMFAHHGPRPREKKTIEKPAGEGTLLNVSLFSGCGLFDHSLGSHGTIKTIFSIDLSPYATLSNRANESGSGNHQIIAGSVNLWTEKIACTDVFNGPVHMISAGFPCPGYSHLNTKRDGERSHRGRSLMTSVLSWVELLSPIYVVVENVVAIDYGPAATQFMCQLVAFGYQCRKMTLKADQYGAATIRSRCFILAAAPGYNLPQVPEPTHSDVDERLEAPVDARTATSDLAPVTNDTVINIRHPDHLPVHRLHTDLKERKVSFRDVARRIPRNPPGELSRSYRLLTDDQKKWFREERPVRTAKGSQCIGRIKASRPLPTMTTTFYPLDARSSGRCLHWEQDRTITLEEARRAQGFPADFLLVRNNVQKLKQVGNAVPGELGAAVGKMIVDSWRKGKRDINSRGTSSMIDHEPRTRFQELQLGLSAIDSTSRRGHIAPPDIGPSSLAAVRTPASTVAVVARRTKIEVIVPVRRPSPPTVTTKNTLLDEPILISDQKIVSKARQNRPKHEVGKAKRHRSMSVEFIEQCSEGTPTSDSAGFSPRQSKRPKTRVNELEDMGFVAWESLGNEFEIVTDRKRRQSGRSSGRSNKISEDDDDDDVIFVSSTTLKRN